MDGVLFESLADRFREQSGSDVRGDATASARIREAAEVAKVELSTSTTARVSLPFLASRSGETLHFHTTISRSELERLVRPVIERCRRPVRKALHDAGIEGGDLFVAVHTRPDARFERRGPHLWRTGEVAPAEAVLGTTLRVPTHDGHARLKVPAGTQPNTVLRLPGKGLPAFGGARGDLHVVLQVRIPEKLTREERELWERLRARRPESGS